MILYTKSRKYETSEFMTKIMGPNPIKILEELLLNHQIPVGSLVCDLGCGQGLTSLFLVKEYNFNVWAADLWSNPEENRHFFEEHGLSDQKIHPVKMDALHLNFEKDFFDAVVSIDSYHYFGHDPKYLDEKLLPFLKPGGYVYIAIPGMKKDCHQNLPKALLLSWTPEQLDTIHDTIYWENIVHQSRSAEVISVHEMESNEEVWADWLKQNNPYAIEDRASMNAGGGKYMNFIAMILRKRINS
jgi:cyclopropane fatty-acyl-phospholipid synthase-like methyltransferase